MSTKEVSKNEETKSTSVADLDMKLEVVVIPVSDVYFANLVIGRPFSEKFLPRASGRPVSNRWLRTSSIPARNFGGCAACHDNKRPCR